MPFYSFELKTPEAPDTVLDKVGQLIRPIPALPGRVVEGVTFWEERPVPFLGQVSGSSFRCYRDIRRRNAFLPVITGKVESSGSGSIVRVRMRLNYLVMAPTVLFLALTAAAFFQYPNKLGSTALTALIPIGALAWLLAEFFPEALKAKRLIRAAVAPNSSFKPKPLRGSA